MMPVLESREAVAVGPAPNFDRLAWLYRWMEALSFGPWLWRCRCVFLCDMRSARRALVLGDGDGRFTARLLRENPTVEVDAVDISPAMVEALVRRARQRADRVHAEVADLRKGSAAIWNRGAVRTQGEGRAYDLVVTHFFLDCLTTDEVEALAARVRAVVADDAIWVVSEFAIPAGWFGRLVARPVIGFLYRAFGWMTGLRVRSLPDHAFALEQTGFRLCRRRSWLGGLLVSERWRAGCRDPSA